MDTLAEEPAGDEDATILKGIELSAVAAWWMLALCLAAVIACALQVRSGQASQGYFATALCIVVCSGAAWVDLTTRRIPNLLTYPAILLGLGINALLAPALELGGATTALVWLGSPGPRECLLGFGLCAAIGIVSFVARGLGGGDVKLLGAVGAFLGLELVAAVLFNTLLVAAIIGVVNWAVKGSLLSRTQAAAYSLMSSRRGGQVLYPFKPTESPFGVALLIGLVLAQFVALHRVMLDVSW